MILQERLVFRDGLTDAQAEALTAYGEARGESTLGIIAVISVIRNRARIKKLRSSYVALSTAAFSCWLDVPGPRGNDDILTTYAHLVVAREPTPYDPTLDVCMYLASRPDLQDPTGGATHYFNPSAVAPPSWSAPPAVRTEMIGHHVFYTHVAF